MISVDIGDGVIREMDEALLTPNHSVVDNDNEHTEVTEFLLDGLVVHRSVHITLKTMPALFAEAGEIPHG